METEKLSLEIEAAKLGWRVVKPPEVRGKSSVEHRFSFLAQAGESSFAFDLYDTVTAVEVLKTYTKEFDTGVSAYMISVSGNASDDAQKLASEYGMKILKPQDVIPFFRASFVPSGKGNSQTVAAV